MKKKQKQKFMVRLRVLPWYWKVVTSIVLFFGGGSIGSYLFTGSSDFEMIAGIVVLAVVLWLLFNMWLPNFKK